MTGKLPPLACALILILTLSSGCGDDPGPTGDSGLAAAGGTGATPGGAQDIAAARELVRNGIIPNKEAFTVEGMFSEHDFPLPAADCASELCLQGAMGWRRGSGWVQIGLSSNVDPETLERSNMAVVFLIDVSGSMGWEYSEYGRPAQITNDLLIAGRPRFVYPGQSLLMVGRGQPQPEAHLHLRCGDEDKVLTIPFDRTVESELAARTYG